MNILALNWQDISNPLAGGAEVHLEELLRRIVGMGHQVTLFCSGYDGAKPEETIAGVNIIRRGNRFNFNLIAPFHLRKLVKENDFDVLIEDINKIPFYTPFYLNIPTLVVIPHLFSTSVFKEINFLLGLYIYLAEMPLVSVYKGRKFNVISESTAGDMVEKGLPADDVSVIHCGIDNSVYSYDDNVGKFEKPTVLYLGRIKKYKSIDHLLYAFDKVQKNIPDAQLNIVGAGDYLDSLKELASKLKLTDKVSFAGFVSEEKKVEYLRRSHVAVYPSLKEGWGLTNIEANACGTAVIAANSPGLRDSVKDGETGFLYEY
ncbi:MAG: glycosyltransferase family 4 protein, partial [candidate division Zixibacteria bacterium]|nr:glycosyltransferase family 4 protein [candidate division Zixibacteria bacterium]